MTPRIGLALVGLCAWLALGCGQELDPRVEESRLAHELAGDLMSPYCPGRTLADCPSPDATAVRDEIRAAVRAGEPADSIRQRIEQRFGLAVVGAPRSALGALFPILILAAGAGLLALALRRVVSKPALPPER